MNNRIAIYGGAFDPPHLGHLAVVKLILASGLADYVWVVPSGDRPDKPQVTAGSLRLEMTKLAFSELAKSNPFVSVRDYQVGNYGVGYGTFDLIAFLTKKFPDSKFFFVIGSELVKDLPKWREAERLKYMIEFLVIERPGEEKWETEDGFSLSLIPNPERVGVDISSSEIRSGVEKGVDCSRFLDPKVFHFINQKKLYKG